MKRTYRTLLLSAGLFLLSSSVFCQGGPPPPPGDPSSGGGPVGGSAPVGGGIEILLALGAAWGSRKIYLLKKETLEQ